jgi:uncharacterized protein (TIGR00297 family)
VSCLAYVRRTLTLDGALAATVVGSLVFRAGGLPGASALLTFFVSSSALSLLRQADTAPGALVQVKGARRDAGQVLANGGVAAAALALGRPGAFLGALATANADTWATEVGMRAWSRPRLITTLRSVEPGTSGAVSWPGLLASAAGAGLVGAAWTLATRDATASKRAALAGVIGSLVDSLLGATAQGVYWCRACQASTEAIIHPRCGSRCHLQRGISWVDNDVVNGLATLSGAVLGTLLWREAGARRST